MLYYAILILPPTLESLVNIANAGISVAANKLRLLFRKIYLIGQCMATLFALSAVMSCELKRSRTREPPHETLLLWLNRLFDVTERRLGASSDLLVIGHLELGNGAGLAVHLHGWEHPSRVEGGQAECGNGDHDTVEDDEVSLILHDGVAPAAHHFTDTVDATSEDSDVGEAKSTDEDLEFAITEGLGG